MAKRTRYAEYKDRYANYDLELSEEGILFMQCHTNGGPLEWYWESHDRMSDAFADIAGDREAAERVELELPETGVCTRGGVEGGASSGCCGGAAPAGAEACCVDDASAKAAGKSGCGCS